MNILKKTFIDNVGQEYTRYYFWAEDKLTRNNKSTLSPTEIARAWTTVDQPYLVLQNPEPAKIAVSAKRENYALSYEFTVKESTLRNGLDELQAQDSNSYNGSGGSFVPGTSYEVGDILEMDHGVVIEITNTSIDFGQVEAFRILYTGNGNIQPNTTLRPVLINGSTPTNSDGNGFFIRPATNNFGGFKMKLSTSMLIDRSESNLVLKINGVEILEKDENSFTNGYRYINKNEIDILYKAAIGDVVTVSYTASRPISSNKIPNRYTRAIIRILKI